ncbi:DNA polymerase [Streptomyces sp. N2-109]|uniref:DNA-directed DNA polymerase n=1 Tax=Streptomyces gossypii TaxID=2883101 RepID=A0ABT2K254_9ACTN|nr:DNA polymerase [Streptomyces gossypii]MCT2594257.1 DNA polymerase [Streptomyces gossypii]
MRDYGGTLAGLPWRGWTIETTEDLVPFFSWIKRRAEHGDRVAVDTEGRGLKVLNGEPGYVRLAQFGTVDESFTVPIELGKPFQEATKWALETLPRLLGHNWHGFDALALHKTFALDYKMLCDKAQDTWLWSKLWDPRGVEEGGTGGRLKPLSAHFIDPSAPDTQGGLEAVFRSLKCGHTKKNQTGWRHVPLFHPVYQEYAHLDVILTSRLFPHLQRGVSRNGTSTKLPGYEHNLARICGSLTIPGLLVDKPYTSALSQRLGEESEKHSAICARYGVDNINSTAQLIAALQDMREEWDRSNPNDLTDGGQLAVSKLVLSRFADINPRTGEPLESRKPNPLAAAVIKAKRAGKWKTAYADHFLADVDCRGAIHPNIRTMEARTGRMSVTNPAVQTLPAGEWSIRRCLLMDPGHVAISVDFDSVELNVLAALADVREMKAAILRKEKLHNTTSRLVFGEGFTKSQYKIGKSGNFLKVYGGGIEKLMSQTGASRAVCERFFSQFNRAYPEVKEYGRRLIREAYGEKQSRGGNLAVRTITGRVLPMDRDRMYAGTNYAVQSTARDCLGMALVRMDEDGLTPYLRLAVHDEVLASAPPENAEDVGREIAKHMNFTLKGVPITATPEIGGRSWGSLYMKDEHDQLIPELAVAQDEFYAANPDVAHARAAA